ncbi:MAG: hypothetical protein E6Q37_02735 [Crocinitomicaceae bacterium]|nr:MAG: hypothetical protein E6Q37_02735 [Crocinitomicaceae bacterium]
MKNNIIILGLLFYLNQFNAQEIRLLSMDKQSDFLIEKITAKDLRSPKDTLLRFTLNVSSGTNTVLRFIISDSILLAGPERKKELNQFLVLIVVDPKDKVLRSLYYNLDNAEYPDCNVLYSTPLIIVKKNKIKLEKLGLLPYKFSLSEYDCITEEYSKISKKHLRLSLSW